ncbi:response regulator transcription factor [Nocardia rhamnosiphila]|uniref:response regulator transcription factor n=1 Tax=Nocardia rhamnosiphila TaxID=426716 RepID=UPI0033EBEC6C
MLVDDQHLVRAGLRMLCETAADLEVVAEAPGGAEAVRLAERTAPDVILINLRMPGMDGIRATTAILAARPGARVLALTTFDDDDHLYPALAAGMCGFLVKDASPGDLLDGIRRAAAGDRPFSPEVLGRLVDTAVAARAQPSRPAAPAVTLTGRETDVLRLVAAGLSNTEIAQRLHIGVTTVKTHIANLLSKTGADNRVKLAMYGLGPAVHRSDDRGLQP